MPADILTRIQNEIHAFSKGQKKIASYILTNYDKAAFMTASRLGKTVEVSESTVVRFAVELGYAGYPAGLYFNQQLGYEELHLPSLQTYTFWLAEYNDTPSFAYHFDLWQYSASGTVDGIEGDVDLNLAFFRK